MLSHPLCFLAHTPGYLSFVSALRDPETAQKRQLCRILKNLEKQKLLLRPLSSSLEAFPHDYPLTSYQDYHKLFESIRLASSPKEFSVRSWVSTSGSTHKRKFFPYTASFLSELNSALSPWLFDLYQRFPMIGSGRHYWSLSWIPPELRANTQSDDSQILSWVKRKLSKTTLINDPKLAYAGTSEEWLEKTSTLLFQTKDLSFISIWSPTFLFSILDKITERYGITDFQKLWPNLSLVSCWDSGSSAYYSRQLQDRLPFVTIQGKGLWMTEAAISIPFQSRKLPALTSHYFEFKCCHSGKVHSLCELEPGQKVEPIVSTSGGLLRYKTGDILEVVDVDKNKIPNLNFLGRDKKRTSSR